MANIAPIIASPQPAPQSSAPTGKSTRSDSSFGAILDQTVASRKTPSPKTASNNDNSDTTPHSEAETQVQPEVPGSQHESADRGAVAPEVDILTESDLIAEANTIVTAIEPDSVSKAAAEDKGFFIGTPESLKEALRVSRTTITGSESSAGTVTTRGSVPNPVPGGMSADQTNSAPTITGTWPVAALPQVEQTVTPSGYFSNTTVNDTSVNTSNQPIISAQLQQLIKDNETSVITINRQPAAAITLVNLDSLKPALQLSEISTSQAVQAPRGYSPGEITPLVASFNQLTSLKSPVADVPEKGSSVKIEPLRQDIRGQFIEAKFETQDKGSNGQSQQSTQQEMTTGTQILSSQNSAPATVDQTATFSQVSQGVLNQALPQNTAPVSTQPVAPPPGASLYEESVFNQVAERFQIHTRNQETQLNIKLHPAELGELKIDLTMREGSIRAHVVAQSGHVREILERNMTRLRGMLESQGITIEEIQISAKSDDIGNFDLLQDQLSKDQRSGPPTSQKTDTSFNETFDSVITAAGIPATSVNITA